MAIQGVDTKCYILALFVRDDGERFLLGSGHYEFKDTQMHFAANAIQNDIVEVQGNDGFLLAGQVRRPGTQSFDGYVGDGTMSKEETESYRRQFFSFFRKNFFYKVIYVFSDGTAIQRKSGFLVDDPTVQELYQMYPEYHVALNFEDVNYYSYSEDEEGQEQYAKEATIDTSSMRATGGLVWDNLGVVWEDPWSDPVTVSGTEIQIENEAGVRASIENLELQGDTYQQTYSGKNLLNLEGRTNRGVTGSVNPDNTVTISGTATISDGIVVFGHVGTLPAGTYTLSISKTLPGVLNLSFASGVSVRIAAGNTSATVTTPQPYTNPGIYFGVANGVTYNETFKMQLVAGSTPDYDFEPYTAGPAPNPDYPQEVQTVTGEQTVEVTGKNLFDKVAEVETSPNYSLNPDGTITTNASNAQTGRRYMTLTMSPGTYTLSFRPYFSGVENPGIRFTIRNMDTSTDYIVKNINNPENGSLQANSFTVENTTSVGFCIIPQARLGDGQTFYFYDTQLEQGSTATAYEPYQSQSYTIDLGSIELCKIGDYQDYIYKGGDGWYLHKDVGGFDLSTGTYVATTSSIRGLTNAPNIKYVPNNQTIGSAVTSGYKIRQGQGLGTAGVGWFAVDTSRVNFNTGSSTNPVGMLYYALATPTDTQITDATLVGQLDALGAMRLFIGENNLTIQATGTNLPAPLSFKYYTTVAMTGAEWEEGGSGGATVVEVDSITNTYPIWRVKGPAVDPQLSVINTNTTIRYTGTVTGTQTLEIDMFNKTAKLNGVSVIGNVSGDWVSLASGTNRVIYTAENADAQPSTIEWQEVVG